jgi:flagellar hook-length control protein FliK
MDGHVDTSTLQNSVAVSTVQAGAELNNSVNDSSQLTPAHIQQIADEVGLSMQTGKSFVRIQLHPQGLGTIDIHLSTDAKGVGVTIMAEHASTGRLLEGQMDSLRQSLTDAGLNLSHIDLGMKGQQNGQGGQQSTQSNQTGTSHEWSARQWDSETNKKYAGTSQQLTLTPSSINYQV